MLIGRSRLRLRHVGISILRFVAGRWREREREKERERERERELTHKYPKLIMTMTQTLSGTESAILNRESGDSESCDSNHAMPRSWLNIDRVQVGLAIQNRFSAILLYCNSTHLYASGNFWPAILGSCHLRFCAAKFRPICSEFSEVVGVGSTDLQVSALRGSWRPRARSQCRQGQRS